MVYEQRKAVREERYHLLAVHSSVPMLGVLRTAQVTLSDAKKDPLRVCKTPTNHHHTEKIGKVPQGGAQ